MSRNGRRHIGPATRGLDSSFRTDVPRMFAVQPLASLPGIAVSLITGSLSDPVPSTWDEIAPERER